MIEKVFLVVLAFAGDPADRFAFPVQSMAACESSLAYLLKRSPDTRHRVGSFGVPRRRLS